MAKIIGIQGVLALAEFRGGRWLYVPKQVDSEHPIAQLIGLKNARALCQVFDGERIMMPSCVEAVRSLRDDEIFYRHYNEGVSLDNLASAYRISQRSVLRALERVKDRGTVSDNHQLTII